MQSHGSLWLRQGSGVQGSASGGYSDRLATDYSGRHAGLVPVALVPSGRSAQRCVRCGAHDAVAVEEVEADSDADIESEIAAAAVGGDVIFVESIAVTAVHLHVWVVS